MLRVRGQCRSRRKRLSGCSPAAITCIRFAPCACSIFVVERGKGGRNSRGQEALDGSGSRSRDTCRCCHRGNVLLPIGRTAHHLTDKDTIVLADFDNKTGDSVFDDTLKQGLSVQLEQSPFLDLVSERKVNETLKLMGRPAGDRLTPEVTREVCQRTGSKAMLTGSIAGLGSQYVIGLKAVNCNTGDVLAEAQEQAAGKEAVLKALDAAAVSLRGKLGESLSSVQKYATPVEEATTPSLEALKAYSLGVKTCSCERGRQPLCPSSSGRWNLTRISPWPTPRMSIAYGNLNEVGRAAENTRKAYELREKVSERERFSIEANYYLDATGELEKAAQVYELWQQTYPRDACLT